MRNNNYDFIYQKPYKGVFNITQCWINGTVKLQYGGIKIGYNIRHINPDTHDKNFEDIKCSKYGLTKVNV